MAVLGYGHLGRAVALNLRDSGAKVRIGNRPDEYGDKARADGFASLALSATTQNDPGTSTKLERGELLADFSLDYGLPGKPGYAYRRPFDYFAFQITASSANVVENVLLRGLLLGDEYQAGRSYRGVWGLYGSYDYIDHARVRESGAMHARSTACDAASALS